MSEPRLISPLLDDFMMGEPISDHHGVRCCPAIEKETEKKYIVKILSLPATPKQLAALLLSGAYHSREAALNYYRELAEDTVKEAQLLQQLSRLEGFAAFENWQIEATDDGFDVYLTGPYSLTLERKTRKECLTHLAAVNLGLDLCAALSVSRRNGYLYVDLKPENIVLSDTKGYLIGDLGFISLRSLKFTSLPEKYRSPYTAPEITDAYSSLNETLDIYAAGMILYRVYNGGQLPEPSEALIPPAYADYEMAEIILKAIDPDPANRWKDPQQMGQAIAGYLQRNTVNDDPIIPPPPAPEPEAEEMQNEECGMQNEEEVAADTLSSEPDEEVEDEIPPEMQNEECRMQNGEEDSADTSVSEPVEEPVEVSDDSQSLRAGAHTGVAIPQEMQNEEEADADVTESSEEAEEEIPQEAEAEEAFEPEQFVIEGFLLDETLPSDENLHELEDAAITDEVTQMLAQADDLIAHKAPDPVIAPEAIEIPMPEPIPLQEEAHVAQEPETPAPEEPQEAQEEAPAQELPAVFEDEDEFELPRPSRKKLVGIIAALVVILLLLGCGLGAKYYYDNIYIQTIENIQCIGAENWLTVSLDTDIDNSLLTVYCTDTYGNKHTSTVRDNMANFTGLASGSAYKITVTISGRHFLTGATTAVYTTAKQTAIEDFNASVGDADGAVILTFSVRGPDSSAWNVVYWAEGEEEKTIACSNHMAMVTGLTVGKEYTFRLESADELYIVSGDRLTFTAPAIIEAEDLQILGFSGGSLMVSWKAPAGVAVPTWTVRCWSSSGFDQSYTVTESAVAIPDLDPALDYTVEVRAEGMTVSKWASITAGSITFKDLLIDSSKAGQLDITWLYEGTAPEGGWTLLYTVDGSDPIAIQCEKNTCTLSPLIPGAHYEFSMELPVGVSIFGTCQGQFDTLSSPAFENYGVRREDFQIRPCLTPETEDWSHTDLKPEDYVNVFTTADHAGLVLNLTWEYQTSPDAVEILYVYRSTDGKRVEVFSAGSTWTDLWLAGYCELALPLPTVPGSYTLEILFNRAYITVAPIEISVTE